MNIAYDEAVQYILDIPKFTKKNPMEHTRLFMEMLGNPQEKIHMIHITGTNGKGSVCAMLTSILREAGAKVGMFTSPHLVRINERIRLDGQEIGDEEFLRMFLQVKQVAEQMEDMPTFFEFIYGMAMVYFAEQKVDYAVVEAGMGGLHDTTNVVMHPELTVITSVGLDHVEYFGNSILDVAKEKIGILKPDVPAVLWAENEEVRALFEEKAKSTKSPYVLVDSMSYSVRKKQNNRIDFLINSSYYVNDVFTVPFSAKYQVENGTIAVLAAEMLQKDAKKTLFTKEVIRRGLEKTRWPGRMEEILPGVIMDGAHNEPGIRAFLQAAGEYTCEGRKKLLFAAVKEKDYEHMVEQIAGSHVFDEIMVTEVPGARNRKADEFARTFQSYGVEAQVESDWEVAFSKALRDKEENDVLMVAGSLYLIGDLIAYIRRKNND